MSPDREYSGKLPEHESHKGQLPHQCRRFLRILSQQHCLATSNPEARYDKGSSFFLKEPRMSKRIPIVISLLLIVLLASMPLLAQDTNVTVPDLTGLTLPKAGALL